MKSGPPKKLRYTEKMRTPSADHGRVRRGMPDMISGMAYKAAMYALELPNVLIAQMTVRVAHG